MNECVSGFIYRIFGILLTCFLFGFYIIQQHVYVLNLYVYFVGSTYHSLSFATISSTCSKLNTQQLNLNLNALCID